MIPDWTFVHLGRVHLLWLAIALIIGLIELRNRDALTQFLSPTMQRRLTAKVSRNRLIARYVFLFLSLAAGVFALMEPQAPGITETVNSAESTADIMFVLDVSKSMLADDVAPNRLARAKVEIEHIVSKLTHHRFGLVAFAGRAVKLCPLTPDHESFNDVLSDVDVNSVDRGGTKIGVAVREAIHAFPSGVGAKLIVLITDGEDQDMSPIDAAKEARDAGIKIVAIGLGSETGSQITLTDPQTGAHTTVMHDGKPVITKLDGDTLRQMALTTEGVYVPAGTAALDLDSIIDAHVAPMVHGGGATSRVIPAERYPWLVLMSMVCLLIALAVGARVVGSGNDDDAAGSAV